MYYIDDFAKISDHFLNISEDPPKIRRFRIFTKDFRSLQKITDDFHWSWSEDDSIINQEILIQFEG